MTFTLRMKIHIHVYMHTYIYVPLPSPFLSMRPNPNIVFDRLGTGDVLMGRRTQKGAGSVHVGTDYSFEAYIRLGLDHNYEPNPNL